MLIRVSKWSVELFVSCIHLLCRALISWIICGKISIVVSPRKISLGTSFASTNFLSKLLYEILEQIQEVVQRDSLHRRSANAIKWSISASRRCFNAVGTRFQQLTTSDTPKDTPSLCLKHFRCSSDFIFKNIVIWISLQIGGCVTYQSQTRALKFQTTQPTAKISNVSPSVSHCFSLSSLCFSIVYTASTKFLILIRLLCLKCILCVSPLPSPCPVAVSLPLKYVPLKNHLETIPLHKRWITSNEWIKLF